MAEHTNLKQNSFIIRIHIPLSISTCMYLQNIYSALIRVTKEANGLNICIIKTKSLKPYKNTTLKLQKPKIIIHAKT